MCLCVILTFPALSHVSIAALVARCRVTLLPWTSSPSPSLSSSPLTFLSPSLLVLHIFIDPPAPRQRLSARIFQPLLTQMNNRSRLLSGSLLHFLIHLHDSICLPGKRELYLDFRTFLCIYCIISRRFILIGKHCMKGNSCRNVMKGNVI